MIPTQEPLPRSQAELESEWLRERFAAISLRTVLARLASLVPARRHASPSGARKRPAGIVSRTG